MSSIPSSLGRTTAQLSSYQLQSQLRKLQKQLSDAQTAISLGRQVNKPSDAPARSAAILLVQSQLDARAQQERNLTHMTSMLNNIDQALADVNDLLIQAKTTGLSQIGVGSDAGTREAEASVIDAQLSALIEIANRKVQDIGLFTGRANGAADGQAFTAFLGGVRFHGSTDALVGDTGLIDALSFNLSGADAFGALSSRVQSLVDLNPVASASTRLADLNGALGAGVTRGTVQLTVNGITRSVDLSTAESLGDVALRLQQSIDATDPTAGTITVTDTGFELTAGATGSVSITDTGTGRTAGDLGLKISASNGATTAGGDVDPRLSSLTALSELQTSVDWTSGLKITQGATTKVADFSGAQTVQDLQNVITSLNLGLRLEVDAQGGSLNLISEVSGIALSVGENAGGSTATDLGLRTFDTTTRLSDFNFGLGVGTAAGADDFSVTLHDGTTFNVNIDGAGSVADVLSKISAAASAAGLTVGAPGDAGTDFNLGLAADGNGLAFEDQTAGAGDFTIEVLNESQAAFDLGIRQNAGGGNVIAGEDNAQVRVENLFTNLINLRDALRNNDSRGIDLATGLLDTDIEHSAQVRALVGVRSQRAEQALERSQELKNAEEILLNDLQGGDLTELILQFTQMQQQLQATLSVGAQNLQLSLLDYLR